MEINVSELDMNGVDEFDVTRFYEEHDKGMNYWEKPKPLPNKKTSFNDILSNMNLVVNKDGVLQFMGLKNDNNANNYDTNYYDTNNTGYVEERNTRQNMSTDHSVKHSYIYNKYFKDYASSEVPVPEIRVPKTIEEYKRMLLEDRIKAIEHKRRMEQIKPKKMLFTNVPGSISNPTTIRASNNRLRSMHFH